MDTRRPDPDRTVAAPTPPTQPRRAESVFTYLILTAPR